MRPSLTLLAVVSLVSPLAAQVPFDFYARGPYRPAVPRPEAITGYAAGEQHTMYAVMQHYLDTLVATASDRVRIETWGRTTEYRPIRALIISDPANLAKLDQIRAGMAELADPRKASAARAADRVRAVRAAEHRGSLQPLPLRHASRPPGAKSAGGARDGGRRAALETASVRGSSLDHGDLLLPARRPGREHESSAPDHEMVRHLWARQRSEERRVGQEGRQAR